MASSRQPREKCGVKLSDDFGSKKTFGWFVPRSIAGQPSSVNQIGFDCGTHAVGRPALDPARAVVVRIRPPGAQILVAEHPWLGRRAIRDRVRTCAVRSAALA